MKKFILIVIAFILLFANQIFGKGDQLWIVKPFLKKILKFLILNFGRI